MFEKFVSKQKEKTILKHHSMLINISNFKYKYALYKSKEQNVFVSLSNDIDCMRLENKQVYHIHNKELGKVLFEAFINNQVDILNVPEKLTNLKFVTVEKLRRVVFIVAESEDKIYLRTRYGEYNEFEGISNIHNYITWLDRSFSQTDKSIGIDYEAFLSEHIGNHRQFWESFFKSISLSDTPYCLDSNVLDTIVRSLSRYIYGTFIRDIREIELTIRANAQNMYKYWKHGIYVKDMDQYKGYQIIPLYMYINIFRYSLNQNCFIKPEEFFVDTMKDKKGLIDKDNICIVFDEEKFKNCIKLVGENDNFEIYNADYIQNYQNKFLRVKDVTNIETIENGFEQLTKDGFVTDLQYVYLLSSDDVYLYKNYKEKTKVTLDKYIEMNSSDVDSITNLILNVNSTFLDKATKRWNIYISKSLSQLEMVYIDTLTNKVSFENIAGMSFKKQQNNNIFRYPLCIMEIIEKFMNINSIKIEDIYKYNFMNLLSSAFVNSFKEYHITGECKASGLIVNLKHTLPYQFHDKIEFLENIPTHDADLTKRISFFEQYHTHELVELIENKKNELESSFDNVCYTSFSDILKDFAKGSIHLSEKSLISFAMDSYNLHDNLLIPEKVIISKDIYDEQNYMIVGVIWEKIELYKLSDLVRAKVINTKNMYSIVQKLILLYVNGFTIAKTKSGIGDLLLDAEFNIVINTTKFNNVKEIITITSKNVESYYRHIMKQINNEFGQHLENFTFFTTSDLMPNKKNNCSNYDMLMNAIMDIRFCDEHKKLYLKENIMCPDCFKVYEFEEPNKFFVQKMETRIARFSEINQKTLIWRSSNTMLAAVSEDVKLGILDSVYYRFAAIVPRKVLIDKNRKPTGIVVDNYNFKDIVDIQSFNYIHRLKAVLTLYKKILPYIKEGTFIATNKEIFSDMFMDKAYKGEIIIPNIALLRTSIILSSDEAAKNKAKDRTLKLFSEFIYQYILGDKELSLEYRNKNEHVVKIIDGIIQCILDEKPIKDYLATKDAFCKVHGTYFSSSEKICPKCIADGIFKEKVIILDNSYFDSLETEDYEYEGGEANLYVNEDGTIDKIFNDKVDVSFKSKVIGKAFGKSNLIKRFNDEHKDIQFVEIDKVLYSFDKGILTLRGYRQKLIPDSFEISSLKEKSFVDELGYGRSDVVNILIKVCIGIQYLHSIGVFIGDLNGGNILIKNKKVYIIDMDGMSYDDVRNCMCTDLYIYPPSAESKNITEVDDWYSLAVQAFYYLTYSHPFRGICDNDIVPLDERERMKFGFSVLGNHQIKKPNISIGWDFMPKELIEFFLATFESNKRESMIDVLNLYLEDINKSQMRFQKVVREKEVSENITENIYIDNCGNLYYKEEYKFSFSSDEECNWQMYDQCVVFPATNMTVVINNQTGNYFVFAKTYDSIEWASDNVIYYSEQGDNIIYIDEVNVQSKEISTREMNRKTNNFLWVLEGNDKNEFAMIEKNDSNNTYDIYLNLKRVCSLTQEDFSEDDVCEILYDKVTDKWLVFISVSGKPKAIIIDKNHNYFSFELGIEDISDSLSFYKNTLYFAGQNTIYMYNVNSNSYKTIYCEYANPKSIVTRIDNRFIINNGEELYVYLKS